MFHSDKIKLIATRDGYTVCDQLGSIVIVSNSSRNDTSSVCILRWLCLFPQSPPFRLHNGSALRGINIVRGGGQVYLLILGSYPILQKQVWGIASMTMD